jgi:electron-transferring-flavoprotein dehydrogenase
MSQTDSIQRETMEADFVIVGGGAAGLSCAYSIASRIKKHNDAITAGTSTQAPLAEPMIVVLEKGIEVGSHSLSGAVLNPSSLRELMPDFKELGCPIESVVHEDSVHYLGKDFSFKLPVTPSPFKNEGNYLISLSKFNRWLATQCEALGVNIFPGFGAVEALYDGDKIIGVRTGDKGLDKNGQPKANFEPGLLIKAKTTIFAEGTRGSLFKQVSKHLNLREGKNPETFEEGVKEVIQMPAGTVTAGEVIHTLGFPLKESIGGTFIYTLPGDKIVIGLVAYLDSKDPLLDPHRELQKLKTHPFLQNMLRGGQVVAYGGKTLPAGGWYSMPQLFGNGWMVLGDSASMVDVQKLKGIHLAIQSGLCAAETAVTALQKDSFSKDTLAQYKKSVDASVIKKDLYRVRNFHQTLGKGLISSLPFIALQEATGGRGLQDPMPSHEDAKTTQSALDIWGPEAFDRDENQLPKPDGKLFYDKLSSVYLTGTMHDEDSPNHLKLQNGDICRTVCEPEYKSPCVQFCPASVYEMVPAKNGEVGKKDLQINYTNCIHCKTCDIKCPFENIDWTVPEGGGGPRYSEL